MKKLVLLLMSTLLVACSTAAPSSSSQSEASISEPVSSAVVEIAALKGPTAMGLSAIDSTEFTPVVYASADEITPKLLKGELDAAAIPLNLAAVLNAKTEGKIKIAAINTWGPLYLVSATDGISSVEDLRGKTIFATGQGTVPEYTLRHVLTENGINPDTDVTVEFRATPDEVAALLASGEAEIAMLPEPFVTVAKQKNAALQTALSLSTLYNDIHGNPFITGVLVMSEEIYSDDDKRNSLLDAYAASVAIINGADVATAAAHVAALDIVPAPIAEKALANCGIDFVTGETMEKAVTEYLTILYEANPASVGGNAPSDALFID